MVKMTIDEFETLVRQGKIVEAELCSRELQQAEPTDAQAIRRMALIASQNGQDALALLYMERAASLVPGSFEYQFQLGCLLAHTGQYERSIPHFEATVFGLPDFAEGWYFKGVALLRSGRDREALAALRRAHSLAGPDDTRILRSLADLEFRIGHPDDALPLWQQLHRLHPDDTVIILKKGETLSRLGTLDQAISTFKQGLDNAPDSAEFWMALAQAYDDDGNREAAAHAFGRTLELKPDWAFPLAGLLALQRDRAPENIVQRAKFLLDSPTINDHDRALLGYELGKVFDSKGEYASAMASWDDANCARLRMTGPFELAQLVIKANDIYKSCTAQSLSRTFGNAGLEDDRFVFIVGMPRSGTTLTEQVIGAHPLAFGCGELPDIALIARRLAFETNVQGHGSCRNFTDLQIAEAIAKYTSAATRHAPSNAIRLIDKAPLNFWDLDLIARMFPQARVIWCRRDPRDIAISIYGENFALDEKYATRIPWILDYIDIQQEIMRHWQKVLPIPIHELHYEQLTSSPELQTRSLLDFVGLEWDNACLEFHQRAAGVQSPSRWQVRQPMHTRSVGRWSNYAGLLTDPETVWQ